MARNVCMKQGQFAVNRVSWGALVDDLCSIGNEDVE